MKNSSRFPHVVTVLFLLTVAVALFSWIGSIYGLGKVQNLLSPEGIRWELRHVLVNYVQTPALGIVMMLFIGCGIASRSGIAGTLGRALSKGRQVSHKERRALVLSSFTLLVYLLTVVCTTFYPWPILRSVTGALANSPFRQGICFLLSFGIGMTGLVFGYASGRFRSDKDIIGGMSCLFVRFAEYFVVLFFVVQFFSSLLYSNLLEWLGVDVCVVHYAFHLCCYLPLLWMLGRKREA